MYPCKWNHTSSEKNAKCGLTSPSMKDYRNQLQKCTLLAGSYGCKACMDYSCFIGSKLQQLCWHSCTSLDTPVSWARHFSNFLGVCSSLAPVSSNFSSVSTLHLCFRVLSKKSVIVLSLFTKLWIVYLLGTLSSRSLYQNFCQHFLEYPYCTWCHTVIHVAVKCTAPWHTALLTNYKYVEQNG
jgi:hypothetical protein